MRIGRWIVSSLIFAAIVATTAYSQPGGVEFAPFDTNRTASGMMYFITHHGTGAMPVAGNVVLVHYTGTLTDGTVFDDSRKRNEPFAFKLGKGQVIKGWDEGIAMLHVGDRAMLVIPPELGYGAKGAGKVIPPNATLLFDVELMDIKDKTLGGAIEEAINTNGTAAAENMVKNLKKGFEKEYYVSEAELNGLGYQYLKQDKLQEAITVLKINTSLFPKSANVYDSLGEAYMKSGNKKLAIANYKQSLQLDPNNKNATEMLEKLKGK